ncbi:MAG: transporter substrate-binding domain-containing protein [Muribaculaceae bacterium]|nr:transporter substrate-binding domain-containing protein [Muribaculaceae bacterium]
MKQLKPITGRLFYYTFLLGGAVLLMFFIRWCSQPGSDPYPRSYVRPGGDTLNIAIEFSPMGVYAADDSLSGFYYDLLNELSKKHNRPIHITGFSRADDMLSLLSDGTLDIVIADIPLTADMKSQYGYTRPLLINRQVLVQLRDTTTNTIPYPTHLSLIGKTVYLPVNSPFKTRLQNLAKEMGGEINIKEHSEYGAEQLIISVALGETPNAVVNSRLAKILQRDYPLLDASIELSLNQFQSWLFNPKDTLLRDSIDAWLDDFKASKKYQVLTEKYF